MIARALRSLLVVAVAATALPSSAHDVRCEKAVGVVASTENGVSFSAPPATTLTLDRYPAQVGFRIRVTNLAPEPSVLTGAWDSLTDGLAGAVTTGDELVGTAIPAGGALERIVAVPVASYEACLALGGEPAALACREGSIENRFVATHEVGSAECRARLVCSPPLTPPPCSAPTWTGQVTFGLGPVDLGHSVAVSCDGSVHVAGEDTTPLYSFDALLATLDPAGAVTEITGWGPTDSDSARSVRIDAVGRLIVAGLYPPSAFVRSLDPSGALLWERTFPDLEAESPFGLTVAADVDGASNVYVAYPSRAGGTSVDVRITKLSPEGVELWSTFVGTDLVDVPDGVAVTPGGDVFVTGTTAGAFPGYASAGAFDAFVARLATGGDLVWARQLGSPAEDRATGIAVDPAGSSALVGYTRGTLAGPAPDPVPPFPLDAFVASLDPSGAIRWLRQLGTAGGDQASGVALDAAAAIWVVGTVGGALPGATSLGQNDGFVARFDALGNVEWARQFGDFLNDALFDITIDAAGHGVATGYLAPASLANANTLIVRVAPDGTY